MKKKIIWIFLLFNLSCKENFEKINTNPITASVGNTAEIFSSIVKKIADAHIAVFVDRELYYWIQHFSPRDTNGDPYQSIVANSSSSIWRCLYMGALSCKRIIDLNEDKNQENRLSQYGSNDGQIALARIMIAYIFQLITDIFGDAPYYSYNKSKIKGNERFATLGDPKSNPEFIPQKEIYLDLLEELKSAVATLEGVKGNIFGDNDLIYKGDPKKWIKLANSLRLRTAYRIEGKSTAARVHIKELESSADLILSSEDNAKFTYGDIQENASPLYDESNYGYMLGSSDIPGISDTLVKVLKGEAQINGKNNPFAGIIDPRLFYYAAPKHFTKDKITSTTSFESFNSYNNGANLAELDSYEGLVYGIGNAASLQENQYSRPGHMVIRKDSNVYFMSATEINFILENYKEAIKCSMKQWGVDLNSKMAQDYLNNQIHSNMDLEKVVIQKWIALFNQPYETWSLIRKEIKKTGLVPDFLLNKGQTVKSGSDSVEFNPSITYPLRLAYPREEINSNVNAPKGSDKYDDKFWWMQ